MDVAANNENILSLVKVKSMALVCASHALGVWEPTFVGPYSCPFVISYFFQLLVGSQLGKTFGGCMWKFLIWWKERSQRGVDEWMGT